MTAFKKWTSIEKFSDTIVSANKSRTRILNMVGKVKLHGTNAGVRIDADGEIHFQKRSQDITIENDNFGFAAWASKVSWIKKSEDYIVWGEWAGNGINNNDAVTKINGKKFFVFAVEKEGKIIWEPSAIEEYIPAHSDILVIPVEFKVSIDIFSQENINDVVNFFNTKVEEMEVVDHYIKSIFGIEGVGEGFVISPFVEGEPDIDQVIYNTFVFKIKTDAHSVNKTKGVKARVEIPPSIYAFVDMFATVPRFEQIYSENFNNEFTMKNTAEFIKLVISDIEKESHNEREASGIKMGDVNKVIPVSIVRWLKSKCDGI